MSLACLSYDSCIVFMLGWTHARFAIDSCVMRTKLFGSPSGHHQHTYTTTLRVIRRLWGEEGKNQLMTTAMIVMTAMLVVRPRVGDDAR